MYCTTSSPSCTTSKLYCIVLYRGSSAGPSESHDPISNHRLDYNTVPSEGGRLDMCCNALTHVSSGAVLEAHEDDGDDGHDGLLPDVVTTMGSVVGVESSRATNQGRVHPVVQCTNNVSCGGQCVQ